MSRARPARRLGRKVVSRLRSAWNAVESRLAPVDTRLYVVGDGSGWVLDHEAREIHAIARQLGWRSSLVVSGGTQGIVRQRIFHTSQFVLPRLVDSGESERNRVAVAYLHGRPSRDNPAFVSCFDAFTALRNVLWRVQVSCSSMEAVVLSSGIDREKVRRIPLGVNLSYFPIQTADARRAARVSLGLPADAVVVGSFQKDGNGWGEGETPKLIKGPDVLLDVLERLRASVPQLHVLLSGAARGFVRRGLERLAVPYVYHWLDDYADIASLYHACDLVLVTSREEGGPKAVLESMASGVPLVSTAVGQAADIIMHGHNGWLAAVEDVKALVIGARTALAMDGDERRAHIAAARATAEANSYDAQRELWRAFFQ